MLREESKKKLHTCGQGRKEKTLSKDLLIYWLLLFLRLLGRTKRHHAKTCRSGGVEKPAAHKSKRSRLLTQVCLSFASRSRDEKKFVDSV